MLPRIKYLLLIPCTIAVGLLVRAKQDLFPDIVNLYLGDALYAVMVFYIYSFIAPYKPTLQRAAYALATCYCVEFLQLYTASWIVTVRATLVGRLILGQGFLYSDLLAYFIGVTVAGITDIFWLSPRKSVADSHLK